MSAVAGYTLLEMRRRLVLLALVVVALGLVVALGVAPLVLPGFPTPLQRADFMLNGLDRFAGFFPLIAGFAIGMTVIYNDLESGAAVAILAKPLTRLAYTVGKTAAALAAQGLVGIALIVATFAALLINGDGSFSYADVVMYFLAATANVVAIVLVLMALTTRFNNIVAAVSAFVVYQAFAAVTTLHSYVVHEAPIADVWKNVINIAYVLVPHQLTSGLPHEIIRVEIAAGLTSACPVITPAGCDPYRGITDASSLTDIASWAAYCAVVAVLLYLSVRRRQV